MVGLPRSGKTTIVKDYYQKLNGYTVVNPDQVRLSLHGQRFVASAEPFVWATVYTMVDALLKCDCDVVLDGCFNTHKRREPFYKYDPKYHLITTSKEECIKRARDTNDLEIISIIEKMAKEFEPLDEREIEVS
jgi:predicted kinase